MCVRQPLIATCGMDRSIHLWNYADRTCELTKTFSEEAYSIAIHPTGLQVGAIVVTGAAQPAPSVLSGHTGRRHCKVVVKTAARTCPAQCLCLAAAPVDAGGVC